jgi:hypothetical protein
MNTENSFSSVSTLRKFLIENNNELRVVHPHKIWVASFAWEQPALLEEVSELEKVLKLYFPEDFKTFLTSVANGAMLYRDARYGQWGYKIYGTNEINQNLERWATIFEQDWAQYFLAIGEIVDESRPIIMNLAKPMENSLGCEILDANPLDPPSNWDKMSRSFHEWIENLITAQGAKYWLWR